MNTYYNDNDQHCCQVIRKNMQLGVLPEGHIDERTIQDVAWGDIAPYQHVHLFAGIAGFALGMLWAGYPLRLRTMTGGFPCTDLSLAGKRAGLQGKASGLWAEMARLIQTCAEHNVLYDYIIIENVPGLLSGGQYDDEETAQEEECKAIQDGSLCPSGTGRMGDTANEFVFQSWMGVILADLAQAGYDATWTVLRASDFGAPHKRERVFIVAYPNGERSSSIGNRLSSRTDDTVSPSSTRGVAHPTSTGKATAQQQGLISSSEFVSEDVAHPTSQQDDRGQQPRIFTNPRPNRTSRARDVVAYTNGDRQWNGTHQQESGVECEGTSDACIHGPLRSLADSSSNQCDRYAELQTGWEQVSGQRNVRPNPDRCPLLADSTEQGLQERRQTELKTFEPQARAGMESKSQRCGELAYPDSERCQECNASTITDRACHIAWRTRAPGNVEDSSSRREWESQEAGGETRAQPLTEQSDTGSIEPGLGRDTDGLPPGMDLVSRWPSGPGHEQYEWEPPRILAGRQKHRVARLKALGNSVIPHCVMHIAQCIIAHENSLALEHVQRSLTQDKVYSALTQEDRERP